MSELSQVAPTGDDTADEMAAAVEARSRASVRRFVSWARWRVPRALYREMGELGALRLLLPESVGGTGAGFLALAAVAEQLAWVYPR